MTTTREEKYGITVNDYGVRFEDSFTGETYSVIPERIQTALRLYITDGAPLGDFLRLVIENNLAACTRADEVCAPLLTNIYKWVYNNMPAYMWGSPEAYAIHVGDWPPRISGRPPNSRGRSNQ